MMPERFKLVSLGYPYGENSQMSKTNGKPRGFYPWLIEQSLFPTGPKRFKLEPGTDGYPDVDTYRDLEFYLEATASAPPL